MIRTLILDQDLCISCNLCVATLLSVCRTGEDQLGATPMAPTRNRFSR